MGKGPLYHRIVEGRTSLLVPDPTGEGVFFNPAAALNRDLSVAITESAGGKTFCDSMAGVGARGIRVANEVEGIERVTLVDLNAESLRLAKRSGSINGVLGKCEFTTGDTDAILTGDFGGKHRQDFVDVDPFGTPIRHIQAGIAATADRGVLSITATDTAVLCGVHRQVCSRRYAALPLNNGFHHETAVRILVNAVRRISASLDLGISPVICHSTRHYIRVYVRVEAGASRADACLRNQGYVLCCSGCGSAASSERAEATCRVCGGKNRIAGPLWVGNLAETRALTKAVEKAEKEGMRQAAKLLESMKRVNSFPPWSYSIEKTCSALRVATVSEKRVAEVLAEKGFSAMRQPFERTGVKTDAPYPEFAQAVRAAGPKS
jgi:tRNA (guanine26-N2/guanine27-N2)-dimethyltransferase